MYGLHPRIFFCFSDIKKEVAELTKAENKLKANKIEVDEKLKNVSKSVNDAKVSIHQWRAKVIINNEHI